MTEWNMDRWKFFDITHRDHIVLNPTSVEKVDEFITLLDLKTGDSVLDVAKAEVIERCLHCLAVDLVFEAGVGILRPAERRVPAPDPGHRNAHVEELEADLEGQR